MNCFKNMLLRLSIITLCCSCSTCSEIDPILKNKSDTVYVNWLARQYAAYDSIQMNSDYTPKRLPASSIVGMQKYALLEFENNRHLSNADRVERIEFWKKSQMEAINYFDIFLKTESKVDQLDVYALLELQSKQIKLLYQMTRNECFKPTKEVD